MLVWGFFWSSQLKWKLRVLSEWTAEVSLCQYCLRAICSRAVLAQICVTQLLPGYSWAKEPQRNRGEQEKTRGKYWVWVTFAVKLGSQSQKCWFCLLEIQDEVLFYSRAVSHVVSQLDLGGILRESLIQTLVGGCSLSRGKVQGGNSTWPFPPVPGALFPTAWDQSVLNSSHSSWGTQMMAAIIPLKCKGRQWKKCPRNLPCKFLRKAADCIKLGSDLTCVFH